LTVLAVVLFEKQYSWKSCSNLVHSVIEKTSGQFFVEYSFGPFQSMATSEEQEGPEDLILVARKLIYR